MRFLLVFCAAGCAAPQDGEYAFSKKDLTNPEKTLEIFKELVRRGDTAKAYDYLLSDDAHAAISKEEFVISFSTYEMIPRLIQSLENHGVDAEGGRMRICAAEFGISRQIRIKSMIGGRIWTLDFMQADRDYFLDRALAWFRKQQEAAGHRFYVYPKNWPYSKVMQRCGCGKSESSTRNGRRGGVPATEDTERTCWKRFPCVPCLPWTPRVSCDGLNHG